MNTRPTITAPRTRVLPFLTRFCLAATLGLTAGCAECDQDFCEEECDWGYTNGESELQACYRACAEEAEACRGPKSRRQSQTQRSRSAGTLDRT